VLILLLDGKMTSIITPWELGSSSPFRFDPLPPSMTKEDIDMTAARLKTFVANFLMLRRSSGMAKDRDVTIRHVRSSTYDWCPEHFRDTSSDTSG